MSAAGLPATKYVGLHLERFGEATPDLGTAVRIEAGANRDPQPPFGG